MLVYAIASIFYNVRSPSSDNSANINHSTMKLESLYEYFYDFCCQPIHFNYSPT
ncbi:hypothetical protein H6F98_23855 [Microcoleus sp. FACHB-SPT15]|uniref:hypothetical protein n=1 Tax=Microcoleus sp. FACHB-SPT15 TaxID=2692830 RepID=UPI0017846DE0|nr:hypothetical protein [Microcoleus sp. FACHB-SPT15]MBD1808467.1 hypothetical protein [Microcoleus sp. FACHB-SPT15]